MFDDIHTKTEIVGLNPYLLIVFELLEETQLMDDLRVTLVNDFLGVSGPPVVESFSALNAQATLPRVFRKVLRRAMVVREVGK